jgi:glycosyltransferase involved in cell wall biosynthesis
MQISIIIPAYNEEKHLPSCLDSIKNLNYPEENMEVILVDNGSSDHTREIARSFGFKVLRNDTMNVSGLRNLGANHSNGHILAFLDADCVVSRDWLQNAERYFNAEDVVAWGSPPALPEFPSWVQRTWYLVRKKDNEPHKVDWLESMNLFVRKKPFFYIGGFNESLVTCEDVDFSYRIGKLGKIISDSRIEAVHLGEASTLKEFVNKELWRGKSNLKGFYSHGLVFNELPSLLVPLYFIFLFIIVFGLYAISQELIWFLIGVFFYLIPSIVVLIKKRSHKAGIISVLKLLYLLQFFFFARTIAIFKK